MKLLDESNKINDDLDHVSFDKSCLPQNEEFDTNEGIQYIDMLYNTAKYQTKNIHQLEIGKIDSFDDYYSNNTATPIKSELNRLNHSLGRQSPSPQLNPICQVFTPQTPSSISDYSFKKHRIVHVGLLILKTQALIVKKHSCQSHHHHQLNSAKLIR